MSVFSEKPVASQSQDGKQLYLKHGPIELVIKAEGVTPQDRKAAYLAAHAAFQTILPDLCGELALLRSPLDPKRALPESVVGKAMRKAILPFAATSFVTPMIAVAGSVADHILRAMRSAANLTKAFVNNGGDIALYLAEGESFELGICSDIGAGTIHKGETLYAADKIGGVATAIADCAATLIANAVDVPNGSQIIRQPANLLSPDSDLGDRLVTVGVGSLKQFDIESALGRGADVAQSYRESGLIVSAYLSLQDRHRIVTTDEVAALGNLTRAGNVQVHHGETYA